MDLTVLSNCPVCYEIIREPVEFPCGHEICLNCFKKSLETANHWCPLCRKRISSWARRNVKNPVNLKKKRKIEEVFANCDPTLLSSTSGNSDTSEICIKLSEPGEVREDYLWELRKIQEEKILEENMSEKEAKRLELENEMFTSERQKEEQLGEALARSIEYEEHRKRLDNAQKDEYDKQMAEVLSQEFILQQIVVRKQQLEQDGQLARKLSNSSDEKSHPKTLLGKKRLDTKSKPITHWFTSLSSSHTTI